MGRRPQLTLLALTLLALGGCSTADRAVAPAAVASAPRATTSTSTTTTVIATTTTPTTAPAAPAAAPAVAPTGTLPGCPPPPKHPVPPGPPAWHPAVLVPDDHLPATPPPSPRVASDAVAGKGMWMWKVKKTEGGDVAAIVRRAVATGLDQIWVRVGDSRDGFYGADVLDVLVPAAHAAGIEVIGWGFPYLWDPAADAAWSRAALDWRGPGGVALDAFSPDVETGTEQVAINARRAVTYLGLVRTAAAGRPLVATVYPPTDKWWASYPYREMAPYVDAFAPMVYWGCREPVDAATEALTRLAPLAPVHLVGQAYNMAETQGRPVSPGADEEGRFLTTARRGGAVGASLWVWQDATAEEWGALAAFRW